MIRRALRWSALLATWLVAANVASAQVPEPHQEATLAKFDPAYRVPAGVEVHGNVVYASPGGRNLRADVFVPAEGDGPFPLAFFVQGSGFNGNNKVHFWREAAHLASLGFVAVTVEHRGLGPDGVRLPGQLNDLRTALSWIVNDSEYPVDPDRSALIGASSGAHMAALLVLQDSLPAGLCVRAVVLISGALDLVYFARHDIRSREYGGMSVTRLAERLLGASFTQDSATWYAASPATHVGPGAPPTLVIHGSDDGTLPAEQARGFHRALVAAGGESRFVLVEGGDHEMTNAFAYRRVLEELTDFLTVHLRPRAGRSRVPPIYERPRP